MVTKQRLERCCPEERRDHILDVAAQMFMDAGYAATSMSAIAASLGGSKATLYKYFPSKEDLFKAVMERQCTSVLAPLRGPASQYEDVDALLNDIGRNYLLSIMRGDTLVLYRVVQAEASRFPEIGKIFLQTGPEAYYRLLAQHLSRLHANGRIALDDPLLTAKQFLGMLRSDLHLRIACGGETAPDDVELDHQVKHAVSIFSAGLRHRDDKFRTGGR